MTRWNAFHAEGLSNVPIELVGASILVQGMRNDNTELSLNSWTPDEVLSSGKGVQKWEGENSIRKNSNGKQFCLFVTRGEQLASAIAKSLGVVFSRKLVVC